MGISIEHYRARIGMHTNCIQMKNYQRYYYRNLDSNLPSGQCGLLSAHINLRAVTCNNMLTDFCKRYDGL